MWFEHVQNLQHRDALAIGRQFPNIVTAIVGRNGIRPIVFVRREVAFAQQATILSSAVAIDLVSNRASIKLASSESAILRSVAASLDCV